MFAQFRHTYQNIGLLWCLILQLRFMEIAWIDEPCKGFIQVLFLQIIHFGLVIFSQVCLEEVNGEVGRERRENSVTLLSSLRQRRWREVKVDMGENPPFIFFHNLFPPNWEGEEIEPLHLFPSLIFCFLSKSGAHNFDKTPIMYLGRWICSFHQKKDNSVIYFYFLRARMYKNEPSDVYSK
jgi:hypothetical protein